MLPLHTPRVRVRRGFTMMEALFAAAVLAFVVAALSQAIVVGQMQTYDAMHSGRAVALAEAMMEEVLALPYDDPGGGVTIGPDADETTRQDFDDVDDYHGYHEATDAIADAEGNLYAGLYQSFTRSVEVVADEVDVAAFGVSQPGLTITVTVQEGSDERRWSVTRFVPEPPQ